MNQGYGRRCPMKAAVGVLVKYDESRNRSKSNRDRL